MNTITKTKIRLLLPLVGALCAFILASSATAAPVTINLCAVQGTVAPLPVVSPSLTVPIWGFGIPTTPGNCSTATASLPGPVLTVNEGDIVTINVINALPAGTATVPHTISFEIPGMPSVPGPTDAVVGATVTRVFTATAPGTYLYQSGGDAGRQEAMGLYGALIVRSATAGQAYDSPATTYDVSATLVLSQIDPNFNAAPDTYNMYNYLATYWLINGRAYADTAGITAGPGQRLLLRYLNAGYDNTAMMLVGMHERVVARDARLLNFPVSASAEDLPAGQTEDAIATMPSFAAPTSHGFPLFNRNLHVTNGAPSSDPGGMLTFIHN